MSLRDDPQYSGKRKLRERERAETARQLALRRGKLAGKSGAASAKAALRQDRRKR